MDIFGFKRRKKERLEKERLKKTAAEQEKLELIKAEKKAYQERKRLILEYLRKYRDEQLSDAREMMRLENEAAEQRNNTCPKCGSTDTIHVMKHINGEIHGNVSSYSSSSFLGYSHSNSSMKVDGHLDTFPVNKCKSCGNEWAVEEIKETPDFVVDDYDKYESYLPEFIVRRVLEYLDQTFDPYDIKEQYSSIEEKQTEFLKKLSSNESLNEYRKAPRYMIEYAMYLGLEDGFYSDADVSIFGDVEGKDQYQYTLPDETWDVAKKIIGWTGPEMHEEY